GNTFGETGIAAPLTLKKADNTVFWLGRDRRGDATIWRMDGYQPIRISNHAIEWEFNQYARIDDAVAYTYQMGGNVFYVLTFPSSDRTWVYNVNGNYWHEWLSFDSATGLYHRHRGVCHF